MRSFEIEVGTARRTLRGRVVGAAAEGRAPRPYVIVVHGYLASMEWGFFPHLASSLAARAIAAVLFDLTGGGVSGRSGAAPGELDDEVAFSRNTYAQELEDLAAVDELVRAGCIAGVDPRVGGLMGHSRGAAMALVHAAERGDVRPLCSWSGGARVARYEPQRLREWERNGHLEVPLGDGRSWRLERDLLEDFEAHRERYDLLAAARRLPGSWQLVHGECDRAVPLDEPRALIEAHQRGAKLVVVPGAGHNFGASGRVGEPPPALRDALAATCDFFASELARA